MASLKEVVNRINLIAFTQKITKAMKMISACKLHKAQQALIPLQEYATQYNMLLEAVLQGMNSSKLSHPLITKKIDQPQNLLCIVVTSSRGLCGAFNKNILKEVSQHLATIQETQAATIEILVVGKKAYQFFKKSHLPIIDSYVDLLDKSNLQGSAKLTTYCIEAFEKNYYTEIKLAYTTFTNAFKQEVTIVPFLPFLPKQEEPFKQSLLVPLHYIYEPSPQLLLEKLVPHILQHKIMGMLVASSASEHAARMATMSQATDNAEELLKMLRISYNRTRQAIITNALAEITSGAKALTEM
ncbi:ATP synthase F1 subunit gamma [Candidatus Cardinium hertigii]|jgi:F-type H+-transporting ATPase subunit gamma|uniref:ATP synthase gamma chain n=1 Tax=Candidatus Cardinium hertigii TaxID=247481 RepID=A0A3N2QC98_9BACT|nr:ATP synthase F1 subunit gamma [Candidatus Cardinium hertigii]ROT46987.1 ATP synthase F1 subunit gamma [Candidatus Cardinium hertigii]ROT47212.1 ATP synthase F1 subunit gamma [Candidatus Cardinium hertigii]